MATDPSDRTIVLNLLRGAVPERANKISGLWRQYGHAVEVVPSATGVTMNADDERIQFNTKTIDLFWLLGFSAWRAIEVYSPALVVATSSGIMLDQAFSNDADLGQYELDLKQHINAAHALIAAKQTDDISWPADIPRPTANRDALGDDQHRTAFDLVLFALEGVFELIVC